MKQNIFKSINLKSDIIYPERLHHYFPTAKTMSLIKAIVFGESTPVNFVIAPYGSGKSLASGVATVLINNHTNHREHLEHFNGVFSEFDTSLPSFIQSRLSSETCGQVVLLYGFEPSLIGKISEAFGVVYDDQKDFVEQLDYIKKESFSDVDRVAIIWDEFGRHLENLVEQGQSHYLDELQMLAEWCSRQQKVLCTFNVLMHQTLSTYSSRLTHTVNKEWKKVGGRFNTMRFVDRSRDVYLLMAKILSEIPTTVDSTTDFASKARMAKNVGWFSDVTETELTQIFQDVHPITPPVLYTLPTLSARLGQNERSLFDFLRLVEDAESLISMENVYQYFSADMQEDVGAGGFYKRWLECQSARSKCVDPIDREILATVTLLQLGVSGERVSLFKDDLIQICGMMHPGQEELIVQKVEGLVERKLLLTRSDNISVWHGIDVDLRNQLSDRIAFLEKTFVLSHELQTHFPLEAIRSHRYNVENNVTRYMALRYISMATLFEEEQGAFRLSSSDDALGRVILVQTEQARAGIQTFLEESNFSERIVHIVVLVPKVIPSLLLEMKALQELLLDKTLLRRDPLIGQEIEGMYDLTLRSLNLHLESLTDLDDSTQVVYFGNRRKDGVLSNNLSSLFTKTYTGYFSIANEVFVRKEINRSKSNVRRKLLGRLFEPAWWDKPYLGYDDATSASATAYRTILRNTGLIQTTVFGNQFFNYEPEYGSLSKVWKTLEKFFDTPGRKTLRAFIDILESPPYGIRGGIIPFLFAVGWQNFGRRVILFQKGTFVNDVFGSTIEDLFNNIEEVEILVVNRAVESYLSKLTDEFFEDAIKFTRSKNVLMALHDCVVWWRSQLPESALKSNPKFGMEVQSFQRLLRTFPDPVSVFLDELPYLLDLQILDTPDGYLQESVSINQVNVDQIISTVKNFHTVIDGIIEGYTKEATQIIYESVCIPDEVSEDWKTRIQNWADCFSLRSESSKRLNSAVRGFLNRVHGVRRYNESSFARALSSLLLGKRFEEWDARSAKDFSEKIRMCVKEIQGEYLTGVEVNPNLKPYIVNTLGSTLSSLMAVTDDTNDLQVILRRHLSEAQIQQMVMGLQKNGT